MQAGQYHYCGRGGSRSVLGPLAGKWAGCYLRSASGRVVRPGGVHFAVICEGNGFRSGDRSPKQYAQDFYSIITGMIVVAPRDLDSSRPGSKKFYVLSHVARCWLSSYDLQLL